MYRCNGCAYFTDHQSYQASYLPLLETNIHTTILSTTSKTVLTQTYKNPSPNGLIKQCQYHFPLYDGVSVVAFECSIGSRTIIGIVKGRAEALATYDSAVAKGQTAGLFQQSYEASDVFSTKLGNIPGGETVVVCTTYVGELNHTSDGIRFTVPTRIAPRYGHTSTAVYTGSGAAHGSIKLTVDVDMPQEMPIQGLSSTSHPIAVTIGMLSDASTAPSLSKASASLSIDSETLDKDFVVVVDVKEVGKPYAILETHPKIKDQRALRVSLLPKFQLPQIRPEIVFVADRSGSMQENIPMLISAMKVFLKSLPTGVSFNICSFGSSTSFLWEESQPYHNETLEAATRHIEMFAANFGGTETLSAIKQTIDRRFKDLQLEVMLLTDGDIWQQGDAF